MPGISFGIAGVYGVIMIERVKRLLAIGTQHRIMVYDLENLGSKVDYVGMLSGLGYRVVEYSDVEGFRYVYETELKTTDIRCAIIVRKELYLPYDIRQAFHEVVLSMQNVFPRLASDVLHNYMADIDLVSYTYDSVPFAFAETKQKMDDVVFAPMNVRGFIDAEESVLIAMAQQAGGYADWIEVAKKNARLEFYAAQIGHERDQSILNNHFKNFILTRYQGLSGVVDKQVPPILPKVLDMVAGDRVALIVADGMSLFDFEVMTRYLQPFEYEYGASFALIPTTTSISRQCLLSGKYPQELENPFSLAKEESGFYEAMLSRDYTAKQVLYVRGYDAEVGDFTRFAAIVINDIDDIVHGQKQGRQGMYRDIELLAQKERLQGLIKRLMSKGFTVYLTADHGNTACMGMGSIRRLGVEVHTKSRRMMVFKSFAEVIPEVNERMFQYPGYYLNKEYRYYICKDNTSFDNKDAVVMTHGGISIEEVVVPFIKFKGAR